MVAASGVPRGDDIGVESVGFVPPHRRERRLPGRPQYPAERQTPCGTDSILRLNATASSPARTDPGYLLVFPSGRQRLALPTSRAPVSAGACRTPSYCRG